MRFEEVLPLFKQEKKIRRSSWNKHCYLFLENGIPIFKKRIFSFVKQPILQEILSEDWEVIE